MKTKVRIIRKMDSNDEGYFKILYLVGETWCNAQSISFKASAPPEDIYNEALNLAEAKRIASILEEYEVIAVMEKVIYETPDNELAYEALPELSQEDLKNECELNSLENQSNEC